MLLLQRVWRLLVNAADLNASLSSPTLLRFLRAALLPQDENAAAAYPPPATDPTLFADFAALWRNTLSYKSIRNVRGHTEHTLTPTLTPSLALTLTLTLTICAATPSTPQPRP